ncbi:hypothetical protein [Nocardioides albus]|uniref:Uncharacterized protein n=1 Tax=Nocardioides albus TaxID=1841 RepID=A0A7W5FAZ1_9ACTN|nr:hypothetical protein [Nocardioides albus]MBB3091778.1 hypothetical protein [Nocardioides albus]GGU31945.1 hypothetical protein GCM10007979_33740 [Nocardioides albus]
MTNSSMPGWALVATLTAVGVLVLISLVAVGLALRARRAARRRLEEAEASEAELRERLEALEKRLTPPAQVNRRRRREEKEYVITSLGEDGEPAEVEQVSRRTLTAPAFADAVFRETVVHSAALVHGVRRALSPEVRFKIRYEMQREVKRARKDRKSEMKEVLREYRARQRDRVDLDTPSPSGSGGSINGGNA